MINRAKQWRLVAVSIPLAFVLTAASCPSKYTKGTPGPSVVLKIDESANPHLEVGVCFEVRKTGPNFLLEPVDCSDAPPHQVQPGNYLATSMCTPPEPCADYLIKAKIKGGGHTNPFDHDLVMTIIAPLDGNGLPKEINLDSRSHPPGSGPHSAHGGAAHAKW
jgi:hypothetical protein